MKLLDEIGGIVGVIAPTIATALGGPLAGNAVRVLASEFLGDPDASQGQISAAIANASPQDMAKLKEIDAKFKTDMANAGVKLEEIAGKDRDSARRMRAEMNDWTPAILGGLILMGFFAMLYVMMKYELPENTKEIMMVMVGALGGMAIQVVNFFFGSSAGSSRKNGIIEKLKAGG